MQICFDIISDLHLTSDDKFIWEGKVTSLYCLVIGNISNDPKVIHRTLSYLSTLYQGIFYIDGSHEHPELINRTDRNDELQKICSTINNTVYLFSEIVIMNGIAIIGINGWYGNYPVETLSDDLLIETYRREDLVYLRNLIRRLQLHGDVRDIIVISNSVPNKQLYFGESNGMIDDLCPTLCIESDTEKKIKYWAFGTYDKKVDITINDINFISNPYNKDQPYWPSRIVIET